MEVDELHDLFLINGDRPVLFLRLFANSFKIQLKDLWRGLKIEMWVVEADMNSRGKNFVKVSNTVRG